MTPEGGRGWRDVRGGGIGEGREWGRGLEKTMGKGMQLPGGLVRILVLVLRAGVR